MRCAGGDSAGRQAEGGGGHVTGDGGARLLRLREVEGEVRRRGVVAGALGQGLGCGLVRVWRRGRWQDAAEAGEAAGRRVLVVEHVRERVEG